ncbi:MAG: hypothetical protein HKO07_07830, partial [Pseudomonadales bacterium]|nr:hypothetical protein [Pseudomonadales bacterium]
MLELQWRCAFTIAFILANQPGQAAGNNPDTRMRTSKFRPSTVLGLCTVIASLAPLPAAATALQDIYDLAVNNDPEIQAAHAEYRAGDTLRGQARAVLLPQLNANYTFTDSDKT